MTMIVYNQVRTKINKEMEWTSDYEPSFIDPIGGYGVYLRELMMINLSLITMTNFQSTQSVGIDYDKYHFKNEDLKFNRDEINER